MWKRLITTLLTAALLLPTLAAAAPSLPDIKGHWAEASIRKAVESGWVDGYPDGSFQPEKTITRAEFTKMLLDAIHLIPDCETIQWMTDTADFGDAKNPGSFTDMSAHWLQTQGWLDAALYSGLVVVADYNEKAFRPEKPIVRYELALMADRALGLVYPANRPVEDMWFFMDGAEFQDWKAGYINEIVKTGVMLGYPDGTFCAYQTATRAEAVVLIRRLLDCMEGDLDPSVKLAVQFRQYQQYDPAELHPILDERELPQVQLQLVDKVLYASVQDLFAAMNEIGAEVSAPEEATKYACYWRPITQEVQVYDTGSFLIAYHFQPGSRKFCWLSDNAPDTEPFAKEALAPLRLLYGRIMFPVYDFSRGDVTPEDPSRGIWYGKWDAGTKTVTIPLHAFKPFPLYS